jgi:hypothetical protein
LEPLRAPPLEREIVERRDAAGERCEEDLGEVVGRRDGHTDTEAQRPDRPTPRECRCPARQPVEVRRPANKGQPAKQVAIDVLRTAGEPLHAKEIAKRVLASGRCAGLRGKTPEATITAMLAVGSKPGGPFSRVDKGTYTLADRAGTGTEPVQPKPGTAKQAATPKSEPPPRSEPQPRPETAAKRPASKRTPAKRAR